MEKLPIAGLEVFLAIAENGSLRSAASALGVQPPTITHHLQNLEQELGVSLVTRTTRAVQLTDAGQLLVKRIKPSIYEIEDALNEVQSLAKSAKGTVRITLPYNAYSLSISRWLAEFGSVYPDIEVELSLNEAFVDILAEGFHAGIRTGRHISDGMIAVKLTGPMREACIASAYYFEKYGKPQIPSDLLNHNCIRYRFIASKRIAEWRFKEEERTYSVDVGGSLILNSTRSIVDAIEEGVGIGQLYYSEVKDEIESGRLQTALDEFSISHQGFYLYYPKAYSNLIALKTFVNFIREKAKEEL